MAGEAARRAGAAIPDVRGVPHRVTVAPEPARCGTFADVSNDAATGRRAVLPLLLCAAGASGAAALIYQIVWLELMSLVIGASAPSLGMLLATFMGGLGLGGWLLPRLDRGRSLRTLAWLELGTAVCGIAVLYGLPRLGDAYAAFAGPGWGGAGLRLIVAAVCLLPPTVLMGATLPAAARFVEATPEGVRRLGLFYAANAAGAAGGALLAAFYLLRAHDSAVATWVAVAANGAAAIASLLAAHRAAPRRAQRRDAHAEIAVAAWPGYAAIAISGMTALSAEALWTREIALVIGGTVYTFAAIVAVLLAGLAGGAAAGASLARRAPNAAFAACQWLACAALAWSAYAIAHSLHLWPTDGEIARADGAALGRTLLRIAAAVLPAALVWGASFPLALAVVARGRDSSRLAGGVYAANTCGAIVGALATTFVLVPVLGGRATLQILIGLAAASGLLIAVRAARRPSGALAAAGVSAAALALVTVVPGVPPKLTAFGRFVDTRAAESEVLYTGEGVSASIAVTREPGGALAYHNAGKTQASTYAEDMRLQRMLGHLATLGADEPRTVLVIGMGAGITAGAASLDPAVRHLVVAEIEPLVPAVAQRYFAVQNFGVVDDSRVEIRLDDGRHVLATSRETFDAITSDPLDPWVKGAAALYTREFWRLCKSKLSAGGAVTAFLQLYETSDTAVQSEIATFFEAFPHGALFANTRDGMGYDAVLFGRADDAPLDLDRIEARLGSAGYARVALSLREVGFASATELLATYAGDATALEAWLRAAPINTDRNLRLQYLAADGLNEARASAIFDALVASGRASTDASFVGAPYRLERLRQAIRAHRGY